MVDIHGGIVDPQWKGKLRAAPRRLSNTYGVTRASISKPVVGSVGIGYAPPPPYRLRLVHTK